MKRNVADRGDVYWIDPNPTKGREIQNRHRFVVITPRAINQLGIVTVVPISSGAPAARVMGLTVPITGYDTTGVVVCNQTRSFDLETRVQDKTASFIEKLDQTLMDEIVTRVISIIDPA